MRLGFFAILALTKINDMDITTKYKQEFTNWLNSEAEMQKLGLSDVFDWQWFITMTSKDTMTKNGARLAMTRFLGQYLLESKTAEVQCFWVAEPHSQGKEGYHIHALLQTKWPVPKQRKRELQLALMLDDIYQRAMGVYVAGETSEGRTRYVDRFGNETNKHRFRAESYAKERGEYCAKYITKGEGVLWEFARVTQSELDRLENESYLWESGEVTERDKKGNYCKKSARQATRERKRALSIAMGEKQIRLRSELATSHENYIKFAKLRASKHALEVEGMVLPTSSMIYY